MDREPDGRTKGSPIGDVVTAIDGYQVGTLDQYNVLYHRSFDDPVRFRVWRKDHYLIVEGPFRQYDFHVALEALNVSADTH
jgi:hypothetical protein